jgi:malate dehydrogenase
MSRMDLLGKNAGIVRDVVERFVPGSPNAIIIVVTNPLDEMTFLAADVSGFPKERVMGMAGVLDSARLRAFIAEELGVSPLVVEAMTLGSHGESMVPLPRHATVDGKPLTELVDDATLERLYRADARRRRRDRGAAEEGERVLRPVGLGRADGRGDRRQHRRAAARLRVVHGPVRHRRVYVGVPVTALGAGVSEIVELDLNDDELAALRAAAEGIRAKCADLATL